MSSSSKKLKVGDYFSLYGNKKMLCKVLAIKDSLMSDLMNEHCPLNQALINRISLVKFETKDGWSGRIRYETAVKTKIGS